MLGSMARVAKKRYERTTLNTGQIEILELLYRYRFGSRQLLADSLGVKPENGLHEKLEVLIRRELVAKRFEKSLKLHGVPAAYYLTPNGMRTLRAFPGHEAITEAIIKASYKDKTASMAAILHILHVYRYTNTLKQHYPTLKVFLKRELAQYSYLPSPLPDAVLSLPMLGQPPKRFFFDLIATTTPRRAIDGRLANYCSFFDEGGWDVTGSDLPTLLLVAETGSSEKRLQYIARAVIHRSDIDELSTYTTTAAALSAENTVAIWTDIEDSDELLSLEETE